VGEGSAKGKLRDTPKGFHLLANFITKTGILPRLVATLYNLPSKVTTTGVSFIGTHLILKQSKDTLAQHLFLALCLISLPRREIRLAQAPEVSIRDLMLVGRRTERGVRDAGESIYDEPFADEFNQRLKFNRRGLVAMANQSRRDTNLSQSVPSHIKVFALNV
jgi:hypothetical protein